MEADRQAVGTCGGEHAFTSAGVKAMRLAKGVDAGCEAGLGDGGDHLLDDHLDIGVARRTFLGLGRKGVGGKQGRDDPHRLIPTDRLGGVEQADFGSGVETVARLDLDRRHPALHQRVEAAAGLVAKLVRAGRLGGADGRGDPATGPRNFLIGGTGAAHGMFVGAGAAEDEMGVAVDQARRDPRAADGGHLPGAEAGQFGALADADDAAIG